MRRGGSLDHQRAAGGRSGGGMGGGGGGGGDPLTIRERLVGGREGGL